VLLLRMAVCWAGPKKLLVRLLARLLAVTVGSTLASVTLMRL
jgi:hypothetical protein